MAEPEEARAVVRELVGLGVDAIKIYAFLEPPVAGAVIEEARSLGVPAVGDFASTPWSVALEHGAEAVLRRCQTLCSGLSVPAGRSLEVLRYVLAVEITAGDDELGIGIAVQCGVAQGLRADGNRKLCRGLWL